MTTRFDSADNARDFGISMAGVNPATVELIEDGTLQVQSAGGFLSDASTPEGRQAIIDDLEGQQGYRFNNVKGVEVGIVVAPFRDGFCVWGVSLPEGTAVRF